MFSVIHRTKKLLCCE